MRGGRGKESLPSFSVSYMSFVVTNFGARNLNRFSNEIKLRQRLYNFLFDRTEVPSD